jgi:hypothetical protein
MHQVELLYGINGSTNNTTMSNGLLTTAAAAASADSALAARIEGVCSNYCYTVAVSHHNAVASNYINTVLFCLV